MTTREIAIAYFDAWKARDANRFRALLTDDATWEGPTWRAANADQIMVAFHQASARVTQVDIQHIWADGDDALTWIEILSNNAPPTPVANWTQVKSDRIAHIRATSDLLPRT
jgi:hypothetical protein